MYEEHESPASGAKTASPNSPTDDLSESIGLLRQLADELHGTLCRCHTKLYGDYQFTSPPTADRPEADGRVRSMTDEVERVRASVQNTLQVAASLESNA